MDDLGQRIQKALAGRYRIEGDPLGEGGMAIVYLALDLKLERHVALKVLKPEVAQPMGAGRFLQEIQIAAKLSHPLILPLHDSGEADGLLYYTMPYVEGESLRQRLDRERQLPLDDALAIARDVAEALDYAHGHDIVHRDIKPGNILLSGGHALVADFGIARAIRAARGDLYQTEEGLVPGTVWYMSPEQASGQDRLDGRSDLWALGCVVFEMLAGEPPFTGPTPTAIMARIRLEPPPSLRIVRPTVSLGLQRVVEKGLAKVPADRPRSVGAFVAALEGAHGGRAGRRRLLQAVLAGVVLLAAAAAWRLVATRQPLDPNKVVVFPLAEAPRDSVPIGTGLALAYVIEIALEHTEPLSWIDGWSLLDGEARADLSRVTARTSRRIARDRGARWYLGGAVVYRGDSATVLLHLNDARGDSLVGRASATGQAADVAQAGLQAVNALLPRILVPGRQVDLSALAERRPAAVANWLQGERDYRRGDFDAALEYLRRAVGEDSAFATAAVRGAQAASWKSLLPEAEQLADLALAHVALLPTRQKHFTRGLRAYLGGQADSAVRGLTLALEASPGWTEAHMALGEVYHHLLPSVAGRLDSLAESEFLAAAADTAFAPPLFHLAEIAIRRGDLTGAERFVRQFERLGTQVAQMPDLNLMLACARRGRQHMDWHTAVGESAVDVLLAGKLLSVAAAYPGCAEDALRAVLAAPAARDYHWGAFAALQGLLAARGDARSIVSLVDSIRASGLWQAANVYVVDALARAPGMEDTFAETIAASREAFGSQYEDSLRNPVLLGLGTLYARAGRRADAERLRGILARHATTEGDREARLFADALAAHLLLERGDSSAALTAFQALTPVTQRDLLIWGYVEALPAERLTVARLLLIRGRYREAIEVASGFEHPTPIAFLPFLPASLALRSRAASALGRAAEADRYRKRLTALGRMDLITESP